MLVEGVTKLCLNPIQNEIKSEIDQIQNKIENISEIQNKSDNEISSPLWN